MDLELHDSPCVCISTDLRILWFGYHNNVDQESKFGFTSDLGPIVPKVEGDFTIVEGEHDVGSPGGCEEERSAGFNQLQTEPLNLIN